MSSIFFQIIPHSVEFSKLPTQGLEIPQPGFFEAAKPNLKLQAWNSSWEAPTTPLGENESENKRKKQQQETQTKNQKS